MVDGNRRLITLFLCPLACAAPADTLAQAQDRQHAHRIFYLSIPPSIFTDVAACASEAASSASGWNRVIVEKPFGRDLASFQELSTELSKSLSEDQMFRIDHYLGKELIENLTARHAVHAGAWVVQAEGLCA